MAEKSPDGPDAKHAIRKELIIGLFAGVVFPTGAILLQRYLPGPGDQGQKASQPPSVNITVQAPPSPVVSNTQEASIDKKSTEKAGRENTKPAPISNPPTTAADSPKQPPPPPTVEQVNKAPEKYSGQKLVFDDVRLLGEADSRAPYFRFNIKTPQGTTYTPDHNEKQRIVFATLGKGKQAKALASSFQKGGDVRVRLMCLVEQIQKSDRFLARIVRLDLVRFGGSAAPPLEEMTAEQLNQQAVKCVGKTVVLDNTTLTGATRDMRMRVALELKSTAGTLFETGLKGNQTLLFTIPAKDQAAKGYIDTRLTGDKSRRLRLVVEVLKLSEGVLRADVKRIDIVAYDRDRPVTLTPSAPAGSDVKVSQAKTTPGGADANKGKANAKTKSGGKN